MNHLHVYELCDSDGVVGLLLATRTHTMTLRTKRSDRAYKTCMAGALLVVFATSLTFITWA